MNLIQNNAFGILGLVSDVSSSEIDKRYKELVKLVKIGKVPDYSFYYDYYNKVRNEENIEYAYKELSLEDKKLLHSFFRIKINNIILNDERTNVIKLTFNMFNTSSLDSETLNNCLDIWKILLSDEKLSEFKQEYIKNNGVGINEDVLFDNIKTKLLQELIYIFSDISDNLSDDLVIKCFIQKFDIEDENVIFPKVDLIIEEIYKVVDRLNNLKISEDGIFDDNEKKILKDSVNDFKNYFEKINYLGLYESSKVKIVRDNVAKCLFTQSNDLNNNLAEYKEALELYNYMLPVSGTEGYKIKLQNSKQIVQKNFDNYGNDSDDNDDEENDEEYDDNKEKNENKQNLIQNTSVDEEKNNKNDINEENSVQEESNIIEKNVDNNVSQDDDEYDDSDITNDNSEQDRLAKFKSNVDNIIGSTCNIEQYNERIFREVFDPVRWEPNLISELVVYIENKYGKKYITGLWPEYFYDNFGTKDIKRPSIYNNIWCNIYFIIVLIVIIISLVTYYYETREEGYYETREEGVFEQESEPIDLLEVNPNVPPLNWGTPTQEPAQKDNSLTINLDGNEKLYLGFAHFNGSAGIDKNMNKAFYWFKESAEMGNPVAQCMLGFMYQDGNGISKNLKEAFYWISKSASQGLRDCQYQLGIFYEQGWGEYKNLSLAFYWIEKAAKQGLLDAQLELGSMYLMGYGVTKNIEQAYYWIKKAADGGNDNAKKILNKNFSTPEYQSSYKYMTRSYTKEELKVIKAIIGADASSSDWDIVTYQKALSYQEKFGLKTDGKIGIETLKAVLNDVNRMSSNMQNKQSLINFLRYMVNRRR